jgi:hypothetical protein
MKNNFVCGAVEIEDEPHVIVFNLEVIAIEEAVPS